MTRQTLPHTTGSNDGSSGPSGQFGRRLRLLPGYPVHVPNPQSSSELSILSTPGADLPMNAPINSNIADPQSEQIRAQRRRSSDTLNTPNFHGHVYLPPTTETDWHFPMSHCSQQFTKFALLLCARKFKTHVHPANVITISLPPEDTSATAETALTTP